VCVCVCGIVVDHIRRLGSHNWDWNPALLHHWLFGVCLEGQSLFPTDRLGSRSLLFVCFVHLPFLPPWVSGSMCIFTHAHTHTSYILCTCLRSSGFGSSACSLCCLFLPLGFLAVWGHCPLNPQRFPARSTSPGMFPGLLPVCACACVCVWCACVPDSVCVCACVIIVEPHHTLCCSGLIRRNRFFPSLFGVSVLFLHP
jgi:hypothetical protein